MKKLIWVVFIVISLCACKSGSNQNGNDTSVQKELSPVQISWIRNKVDSTMASNNIPALSVGIISNGKLSYVEGFGNINRESNIKVDGNTLYQIGSDTKKFTAIIVNNLVSEGKLNLDEPIATYLQDVLTSDGRQTVSGITLRTLLHHTSGIPNREPSNKRIDGDPMLVEFTAEDITNDLNSMKLDFEPGTKFGYSNFGYAIAGFICEIVTGQDYSVLIKKYITDKYNLPYTVIYPDQNQLKLVAEPYRKDDRNIKSEPWKMGKMTPAGGIYSNIFDLSKLMIAQIEAYRDFHKIGKTDDPLLLTENDGIEESHYGFGLSKTIDETGTRIGHGGDMDGYASGYVFMPDNNLGLIMLTSSGGKWFGQLEKEIRVFLTVNNN